jgi:DNA-binding transcriptional ArsR family regulator
MPQPHAPSTNAADTTCQPKNLLRALAPIRAAFHIGRLGIIIDARTRAVLRRGPKHADRGRVKLARIGNRAKERTMASNARFAEVATLAGDPARASILHALLDGRALTASELARAAGVTPQTASEHLGRLVAGGLLRVEKQGRHRYHRLASGEVAQMMESIMQVASRLEAMRAPVVTGPRDEALRAGRTCYDHFAGRLGVALTDALVQRGHLQLAADAGLLTASGVELFGKLGIDVPGLLDERGKRRRVFCRPCIDWSERRPHLAGAVGAALCTQSFAKDWVKRIEGTRGVRVTPRGRQIFHDLIGMRW